MGARHWGGWVCFLAVLWLGAGVIVSCGGSTKKATGSSSGGSADGAAGGSGDDGSPADATGGGVLEDHIVGVTPDGGVFNTDGSGGCVAMTCAQLGFNCGQNADGCGGTIDCGGCPGSQRCGGGGFSVCGSGSTDASADATVAVCQPKTCASAAYDCGNAGDGCGGTLSCGACPATQYCGGGGFNKCGGTTGLATDGSVPCTPLTSCTAGRNCGYQSDGCGGVLTCGTCTAPLYCGGGGFDQCGGNTGHAPDGSTICNPITCASQGFNCGPAGDGCGGLLQCGTCGGSLTCGGGGTPGRCGNSLCTGLCLGEQQCDGGLLTTLTGRVIAGTLPTYGNPDPVPNVLVYVPNSPLSAFKPGVQCSQCGADVSGSPLASATTKFDGTFTLTNVPAGSSIPIVIQLGRWRREVHVAVSACATNAAGDIRMPRNQGEGDIPLTAISTGAVDSIECVLLKMGVDAAEFTPSSGTGRIQLYSQASDYNTGGGYGAGVTAGPGTVGEPALLDVGGSFMRYDQILLPCWGSRIIKDNNELGNLVTYANAGGHFFATHYSYSWLFQNAPFNTTAQFNPDHSRSDTNSWTGNVQLPPVNPKGTVFSEWLGLVGALSNPAPPQISISSPRHDVNGVTATSVDWIDGTDPTDGTHMTFHYTFDTPVGGVNQCGHAIYSDFHVTNAATSPRVAFPAECTKAPLSAQEKVLEFMIWDLASCVGPPPQPMCTKVTCQQQNIGCGPAGDGCGGQLDCGPCAPPLACGGGGTPGQCGAPPGVSCPPKTCQALNINCGPADDGCGNLIQCGPCIAPQTCGGGGVPGQCGYPDAASCVPQTCAQQNLTCGPTGDGCGNLLQCGNCMPPDTCGGAGVPGQCGSIDAGMCAPTTCSAQSIECGPAGDGCGNLLDCGNCSGNQTCGIGATAGKCGSPK